MARKTTYITHPKRSLIFHAASLFDWYTKHPEIYSSKRIVVTSERSKRHERIIHSFRKSPQDANITV